MIAAHNVTKYFDTTRGRRYVFRDLSFTLPMHCNVGLIGRNGAGKSTLMRLISGVDRPDRGQIITGENVSWPVGLTGGFLGTLTGRDNCKFVCRVHGAEGDDLKRRVAFVQDFADIGKWFDEPVKTYSSGMRSRVAFGLSMAFDFDYYLIDEVMSVGDGSFKRKSSVLFKEKLKTSNVILVTHSMSEVRRLCDVVLLLEDGKAKIYDNVGAGIKAYQDSW